MTAAKWGGRKAAAWSGAVLREYGRVCHLRLPGCTVVATEADHLVPRSVDPDRQYDVANGRPACRHCNRRRSATPLARRPVVDDRAFFESPSTQRTDVHSSPPRDVRKFRRTEPREARP